jgi:signal transduction histidine kinase
VLYNLLDNAVKYSPEGGQVVVEAKLSGDFAVVGVSDEGLGIPEEERGTLFERFRRGVSARKRGIGGSGLGLAICKGIVEAHGGTIWVESPAPGRSRESANPGSVVSFTLPLASAAAWEGRQRLVSGSASERP